MALQNSALHWHEKEGLTAAEERASSDLFLFETHAAFRQLVLRTGFSCIGAKAAFHDRAYGFATYSMLGSAQSTAGLCRDLCHFAQSEIVRQSEYATLVTV